MEALWKKQDSLQEFVAADQFKSYEDLKKRLSYVLGNKARPVTDESFEDESEGRGSAEELVTAATSTPRSTSSVDTEEDDALSYFSKLAEE